MSQLIVWLFASLVILFSELCTGEKQVSSRRMSFGVVAILAIAMIMHFFLHRLMYGE